VSFGWTVQGADGPARAGTLHTVHGDVATPVFMPVGTAGTVKAMTADAVRSTGAGLVLGNTYHLMLRPGAERVAALGGLHRFMDWPGPILTDSGGFQVMSLAGLRRMDEDGVTFRSHLDGAAHRLTPETSTAIQDQLDATITMAFDECTPFPAPEDAVRLSMELSMRWGSTAMPLAAWPWAKARRRCSACWIRPCRCCRRTGRAILWALARRTTWSARCCAGSICSIA
jgi:queuine tRNA-ribosyltransferase